MEALQVQGINVFEGFFQSVRDRLTGLVHIREKQSDVALAVHLYRHASQNEYDVAALLTGDSDFVPALRAIGQDYPGKQLLLVTPPSARKCGELMQWTTLPRRKTYASLLRLCQLPNRLENKGKTIINPYLNMQEA